MKYKVVITLFTTLSLFLNSCGSGSDNPTDTLVFEQENKTFLHDLFLSEYLWYDEVAFNVDYTQYDAPQMMIDDLRVTPPDQWSFVMTAQEYEDLINQSASGFGFGYTPEFTIYLVRIDAPAYEKLYRGDRILEINSQPATQELIKEASENVGFETVFTVLRGDQELEVRVTSSPYTFKVSSGKIITHDSKNVGYLRYDSFTENSVDEFETIFDTFHSANNELVIDLRYNGGGAIIAASMLLDNITNAYPGQRQVYLDWNDNYKDNNRIYTFEDADTQDDNELTMSRVIFLVTHNSASASELVISALKPYLGDTNIVTIGSPTHGKPVGMSGRIDGSFYYFLVNFLVRNNDGVHTDFNGIPVTCSAEDDLTHSRGDINETMLSTALYYISNNACP